MDNEYHSEEEPSIAIVGMACHFPGAKNIDEYWSNLRDGVESVRFYSDEELIEFGETVESLANPNYVRAQPELLDFDRFDAKFWGFSPQDAAVTDPAHRLFLEVAYQSLEHAGHTGYDSEGTVGVFASSGASLYWMEHLKSNPNLMEEMGEFLVRHTGNDMNFLATRLSYELDLRGPSLNVQTACSSTLVAIHLAVQSLLGEECDFAIAGGSTVLLPQKRGYIYKEGEILSPDGHCRPFDAKSAGTVFGSGAGSLVLRRLDDAIRDGDTVYAVIAGTAINNDGAQKIGYLAPGVEGQAGVISEALQFSGADANSISYIEAHGTGTQVGDPIELEALNQVFRAATSDRNFCRVGSVKSNIGHLGEAAGAAAIIKVVLALQNKKLPATINFETPNPEMELGDSPFSINDKLIDWEPINSKRLAGITALGAGGTNAHMIVAEAPAGEASSISQRRQQVIVLSAKTSSALTAASRNLANSIRDQAELNVADMAYTLQVGRRAYAHRKVLVVDDREDAIAKLESLSEKHVFESETKDQDKPLIMMFPGGGAQYAGMGIDLYASEPVYKEAFDACLNCIDTDAATVIRQLVLTAEDVENASSLLQQPSKTLPSLFATEYALAKLFMSWGAAPKAFIGHSMGEYTAACLAGVMQLQDAMRLVELRGRLFERVSSGGMLSVSLSAPDAKEHMSDDLDIAAVNAPDLCVASGPVGSIEKLQKLLEQKDIDCTRIRIEVAAHSSMLDEILDEFRVFCRTINLSKPEIPFTSNLTGSWISDEEAIDPDYWVSHLRNTVRFAENVETAVSGSPSVLLEVGPGRTLTNLALAGSVGGVVALNSMRHANEQYSDLSYALESLGQVWGHGAAIDWDALRKNESRQRIALPTYPFERKVYWIDPGNVALSADADPSGPITKRSDPNEWFGQLAWIQRSLAPITDQSTSSENSGSWLIFEDNVGLSNVLIDKLGSSNRLVRVRQGSNFVQSSEDSFQLSGGNVEDLSKLFSSLSELPQHILYCWPTTLPSDTPASSAERLNDYDESMRLCFWGLFNLAKVLGEQDETIQLTVVSSDMHGIAGPGSPEKTLLLGPVTVLPRELANVQTRSIDVSASSLTADVLEKLAMQILGEIWSNGDDRVVAYRGPDRWVRQISNVTLPVQSESTLWLRGGGTFLITGGLGGIGLSIAQHLAKTGAGKLVLMSRRALPKKMDWESWISDHSDEDETSLIIQKLFEIEALDCSVLTVSADVTNETNMSAAIGDVITQCGEIHGVIHAAGSMDDQLIMMKSVESAQSVIDAKVKGALILDKVLATQKLDFFTVFSSVASYLGLPGQADYTAANAFLDAFARNRSHQAAGRSIAINWNAWRDVGMVVDGQSALKSEFGKGAEKRRASHPYLDYFVDSYDSSRTFGTHFSVEKHWLLAEHRLANGLAVMPGTGFVELLRGAFIEHCKIEASDPESILRMGVELSGLQFLSAFEVLDAQERELNISVSGTSDKASLSIYSDTDELPHVLGEARLFELGPNQSLDLDVIRLRCPSKATLRGQHLDQEFMDFGPRWGCIKNVSYGTHEAIIEIELPDTFTQELSVYKLHPSMLDMATGAAQMLIQGFSKSEDFYVPIGYEKLSLFGEMPGSFSSHVSYDEESPNGYAKFDVMLADDSGNLFAKIHGFTMRKMDDGFSSSADLGNTAQSSLSATLAGVLEEALSPAEGVEAFDRVMSQNGQAQWIISSVDSKKWLHQLDSEGRPGSGVTNLTYVREDIHDPDEDKAIAEIEQTLAAHEAVEALVVRSFLDEVGDRRLIAFYLPDYDHSVTLSELRSHATSVLSSECVPQYFVEMDEFPKSEDGSTDRSVLKDPFAPEDTYVGPNTSTEKALANVWKEVLGASRIGLADNFFDSGGHSILSIRVIVKVDKLLGVRLEATSLVMNTLEQIASEIDDRLGNTGAADEQVPEAPGQSAEQEQKKRGSLLGFILGKS